jgi:protein AroM
VLGLVTIGQSPREDVIQSMFGTRARSQLVEVGALDLLSAEAIDRLAPFGDEHPLVTRLRCGREVVVAKDRLVPRLELAVQRATAEGATLICVLCTGDFPRLKSRVPIVYPDRLLASVMDVLYPKGVLGVIMPHAGQRDSMVAKWSSDVRTVITGTASPYSAADSIACEVARLTDAGADAVVLDCMGFDRRMLRDARASTDRPVVLANALVGAVLREFTTASFDQLDEIQ